MKNRIVGGKGCCRPLPNEPENSIYIRKYHLKEYGISV